MNIRRIAVLVVVLCAAVVPAKAWGQLTNDVIRGRVTGPDTLPLKDVLVKATSYQGQVTKTANTDKNGRYTIIFVNGEGDYWLDFTKIGFTPKRYEIKKVDQEEILIGDAKLGSAIAQLDAVNITAQNRALVNRNSNTGDVGGGDKSLPVNSAQLPPDQAGNLAALASTIPGIQLIPGMDGAADMFSALGLGGDQNSTTFNGLGSGINMLPPDAVVGVRFNSFPWQVSAGGFSGAQISLFSQPGSNYSYRLMSGYGTGPDLQWTDENADSTGLKSTTLRFGGNARGPIRMDKAFYNSSYSGQRTFSDLLTLLNTSPIGLNAVGVSADSVARMLSILRGKGVPVSVARTPSFRATDQATLQTNVDLVPSTSGTGNAFTLGLNAVYVHAQPIGGGSLITTTPARTGESEFYVTQASLNHSNYFWFGVLSQTTLGYSLSHQIQFPFLNYPNGVVRVASDLPDGSSAIRSLSFGGGNQPFTAVNQVVALNNTLRWYSENNKHAITMTEGVTREHNTQDISPSPGSFSFNSLSDLENGIPRAIRACCRRSTRRLIS